MVTKEEKQQEIEEVRGKLKQLFDFAWGMKKTENGSDADKLRRMVCSFVPEIEQSYTAFAESEDTKHEQKDSEPTSINKRVIVRTWDDMAEDAEILSNGQYKYISLPSAHFTEPMKPFCGKKAKVVWKNGHICALRFENSKLNFESKRWTFTDYMLKPDGKPTYWVSRSHTGSIITSQVTRRRITLYGNVRQ